jgi:hypothetical protein
VPECRGGPRGIAPSTALVGYGPLTRKTRTGGRDAWLGTSRASRQVWSSAVPASDSEGVLGWAIRAHIEASRP